MRYSMLRLSPLVVLVVAGGLARSGVGHAEVVTFEDLPFPQGQDYWNGTDPNPNDELGQVNQFSSQGVTFHNFRQDSVFGGQTYSYWDGWAYSRTKDTQTPGYENQFSAYPGSGVSQSLVYGVSYVDAGGAESARIDLPANVRLQGMYLTNTTYAYLGMRDGIPKPGNPSEWWAKPLGGTDGTEPDWVKLTIVGYDASDKKLASIDFHLADYRNLDGKPDTIVDQWTWVDLATLQDARTLKFAMDEDASDKSFGWDNNLYLDHPAYFAMDNLTFAPVPEPSAGVLIVSGLGLLILVRRLRRV